MALYDFICNECKNIWEVSCKISDRDTSRECPVCGSGKVERHHTQGLTMGDPVHLGLKKVPEGFKDVMNNIKNKAIGGKNIKTNW